MPLSGDPGRLAPGLTPRGAAELRALVERAVDIIVAEARPIAVVLYGSFGRGEATVVEEPGQGVRAASDLEVGVVVSAPLMLQRRRGAVVGRLRDETGLDVTLSAFSPERLTSRRASNWSLGRSVLTLEQYDLLASHRLVWGSLPAPALAVPESSEIWWWDAARIVLNRVVEAALPLSEERECGPRTRAADRKSVV